MKKLTILTLLLSFCYCNFSLQAGLVDSIKNDLIDPNAKSNDKKKNPRGQDEEDTENNTGKTRVNENNRYQNDLNNFRYLAFYFSNKSASKTYKKAEDKLKNFYSKLKKKNDNASQNPEMEVIFVSRDFIEKDMTIYEFPHMDFLSGKKNISINKYAGKSLPCLVVVNRSSGGILFGGHIATVINKLEDIVDVSDEHVDQEK